MENGSLLLRFLWSFEATFTLILLCFAGHKRFSFFLFFVVFCELPYVLRRPGVFWCWFSFVGHRRFFFFFLLVDVWREYELCAPFLRATLVSLVVLIFWWLMVTSLTSLIRWWRTGTTAVYFGRTDVVSLRGGSSHAQVWKRYLRFVILMLI